MKQYYILLLITALFSYKSFAANNDIENLRAWKAASVVSEKSVKEYGVDSCFMALPIDDGIFSRIYLKSYKKECTIKRSSLRYLRVLHRNIDGNIQLGEIICNVSIAKDLLEIFKELYTNNYKIERVTLVDNYDADDEKSMTANNTSCFNYRKVSNSTKLSKHSQGLAIDINPLYNPCHRLKTGIVEPANGKPYLVNRNNPNKLKISFIDKNDLCYKLFVKHGFIWGGNWQTVKDYQHFEK